VLHWKIRKKAIINLIDKLEDDDGIHLVIYDNDVDVVFQNKGKKNSDQLIELVQNISSRNSTNISKAIEKSVSILNDSQCQYDKIIFLFSDGNVNEGIQNLDQICKLFRK
jgi:hypothetical protein